MRYSLPMLYRAHDEARYNLETAKRKGASKDKLAHLARLDREAVEAITKINRRRRGFRSG
jgi:hypothetical protein